MTTKDSQDISQKALSLLFASSARAKVLRLFMLDPCREYYQRQIEKSTGLAIRAVQRELERLSELGLLFRRVEGNRTYYQVDVDFPLFPELQGLILKAGDDFDRLRAFAAMERGVIVALLDESKTKALCVTEGAGRLSRGAPGPYSVEVMTSDRFLELLSASPARLAPFLSTGVDLLGRRDGLIWRRIESAGYNVSKGRGVA
ncbi:MAG TPA: winged helix-turn-helix domain-containing protein [Candidatus Hydrogenedentes bacterium]|jgi:DNA-binding transcriptional ArsR family regulator|nr:winged helix-turn-helix domain-containing protein [Candidatus Hydrogenedentota bacterium]